MMQSLQHISCAKIEAARLALVIRDEILVMYRRFNPELKGEVERGEEKKRKLGAL